MVRIPQSSPTWKDIQSSFSAKGGGALTKERGSLKATTPFFELTEASPQLRSLISRFGKAAKNLLEGPDAKNLATIVDLLNSTKLVARVKGMELFYDKLDGLITAAGGSAFKGLIAKAVDELGPDVLRTIPQVEFSYQRYLKKHGNKPVTELSFENFLSTTKSRGLKILLRSLLTANQFKIIRATNEIYSPALSSIIIGQKKANELISTLADAMNILPETTILAMLQRKLGSIMDADTNAKMAGLLKTGKMVTRIVESDVTRMFIKGLRRNLQGNIGEALALPKQAGRLKEASKKGEAIYLVMDVRVSGRRIIVDKKAPGRKGDTSAPAYDKAIEELEFSDSMIVDLGNPPNLKIVEHHETKVTGQSIADGVKQFDYNREQLEFATKLSFGEMYKWENNKLTKIKLDDIKGYGKQTGKSGERLIVEEAKDFVESAKNRERLLDLELEKIDAMKHLTKEERIARRGAAIRDYAAQDARKIEGIGSSQKVLFTPSEQKGKIPKHLKKHILSVPLGYTYKNIIDMCNLLFLRGGFKSLTD